MRQILPEPADIDPFEMHRSYQRSAAGDRCWVLANMVTSIDGATAVDGVSGGLSSTADKQIFSALRSVADVILVGAQTARAENYGPPKTSEVQQQIRLADGQAPIPRLVLVSGSLDLDTSLPMFAEGLQRPLIFTKALNDETKPRAEALGEHAEIVVAGETSVDMKSAVRHLSETGVRTVLCEGGPSLLGQLLGVGLIDELDLTISPLLVGGDSRRAVSGSAVPPADMTIGHLWQDDDYLFARYVTRR